MDRQQYNQGLALSILPENHRYEFQKIKVFSELDENGEMQIEIVGRADVQTVEHTKLFLDELYESTGATFNICSGRADRYGKDALVWGYRKCIMQVKQKRMTTPKRKGLHQDCKAELHFKLERAKVIYNICGYFILFIS